MWTALKQWLCGLCWHGERRLTLVKDPKGNGSGYFTMACHICGKEL